MEPSASSNHPKFCISNEPETPKEATIKKNTKKTTKNQKKIYHREEERTPSKGSNGKCCICVHLPLSLYLSFW